MYLWHCSICFEINNIKYRNSSYVISKVSFSSEAMWPEVNFLWDSQEEVPVQIFLWFEPLPLSLLPPSQTKESIIWDIQYILSELRAAVQTHLLFVLLRLIWDENTKSHQKPTWNTNFSLTGRMLIWAHIHNSHRWEPIRRLIAKFSHFLVAIFI